MIDPHDDMRVELAAMLHPGDELELVAAGGGLVDVVIERVEGVDFAVEVRDGAILAVGSLLSGRLHDGLEAWFCTFIVLDGAELPGGGREVALRLGDADRIATERWSERRALTCPVLVRREGDGVLLRGMAVDGSSLGVAVLLREGDVLPGSMVGVTLAGVGGGGIAFRGLVRRRTWSDDARLLGIEIADVSPGDRARLERALAAAERS